MLLLRHQCCLLGLTRFRRDKAEDYDCQLRNFDTTESQYQFIIWSTTESSLLIDCKAPGNRAVDLQVPSLFPS